MKRAYHKSEIANASMYCFCLAATICAIFLGFACLATALDEGDTKIRTQAILIY